MRIIAPLVCTFLLSLALPSLSFAGANCENAGSANAAKNCVKYNNNQNGNGIAAKAIAMEMAIAATRPRTRPKTMMMITRSIAGISIALPCAVNALKGAEIE